MPAHGRKIGWQRATRLLHVEKTPAFSSAEFLAGAECLSRNLKEDSGGSDWQKQLHIWHGRDIYRWDKMYPSVQDIATVSNWVFYLPAYQIIAWSNVVLARNLREQ